MLYKFALAVALAASSAVAQNNNQNKGGQNNNNNNNNANNNAADGLTLLANAVQKGSAQDGSANIAAGQALSLTSDNNFINFCSGKTLTDGLQVQGGSCNGVGAYITPKKYQSIFLTRDSHGRHSFQIQHGLIHNHLPNTGWRRRPSRHHLRHQSPNGQLRRRNLHQRR